MPEPSEPLDRKRALLEAAEAAVQESRDRARPSHGPRRPRGPNPFSIGLALLASVFGIYLMVAQPAWFLTPPPPPDPPAMREASARLTVVREASRIEQVRAETGRVPATLEEAGSGVAGLQYFPSGDGYTLRWVLSGDTLTWSSRDSVADFLGNSLATVLARGTPR